jgi:hypothetical protein
MPLISTAKDWTELNNALTRFTLSSVRVRASKYAVFFIVLGTSFFWSPTAQAVQAGANVVCARQDGSQQSFQIGWDNSQQFFANRGYIPRLFCEGGYASNFTTYISDDLSDSSLGYYNGVAPTPTPTVSPTPEPSPSPSPTPSETPTVVDDPVVETVTPVAPSDTETVPGNADTSTPVSETPTVVDTSTATSTPPPPVEPAPSVPAPPPVVEPQPVPQPEPAPEPPASAEEPPVAEEPPPAEEPAPPVVEEEPPLPPVEPEPPAPEPEPLPEPVAEPEPELPPDIAPVPPSINDVNLESLPPSTPVTLDNGVVVTAEVAIAVALLQDPAALLQKLFTDPAAAFAALGSVGADLPPEVRERAEEVVIASVIVGNIATSAAAAAAGAAYRRK